MTDKHLSTQFDAEAPAASRPAMLENGRHGGIGRTARTMLVTSAPTSPPTCDRRARVNATEMRSTVI
jgi:hypothetical protein